MNSAVRQAANAANAQHSTGPRTEEGKARTAQNARKHGLTSGHLEVSPGDRPEYDALESSLRNDIQPLNSIQEFVFQQLLHAAWKLYVLLPRLESEALTLPSAESFKTLDRLSIYRARIERSYYCHQKELTSLQERSMLKHAMMQHSPDYPCLVDVGRIRKEMELYFKNQPPQNKQTQREEQELEYIRQIEEETQRFEASPSNATAKWAAKVTAKV
jgi:hypothetical protein